jgi:Transcriptional regulator, AbiEi antitoxin
MLVLCMTLDAPICAHVKPERTGRGYFNAAEARGHGVSRQLLDHHIRHGRFERIRRGLYHISGFSSTGQR